MVRKRLPKFQRAPELFGRLVLTDRDLSILDLVHRYRYVWLDHILALVPANGTRHLEHRVRGLYDHGYLHRLWPPARMNQGGGVRFTYVLDEKGARTLAAHYQVPKKELFWRKRHNDRTEFFVTHHTTVSDFHAALELGIGEAGGLTLIEWDQGDAIRGKATYNVPGKGRRTWGVNPDGYLAVADNGTRRNLFVEIDLDSEEYPRIADKYERYTWYLNSNTYKQAYERASDVRVLFATTSFTRLEGLIKTLQQLTLPANKREKLFRRFDVPGIQPGWFWFTLLSDYDLAAPASVLEPIWRTAKQPDQLKQLF